MWARIDKSTNRVKHWSQPRFTTPVTSSELDVELPDNTPIPDEIPLLRLNADFSGLEVDPALAPVIYSWTSPDRRGSARVSKASDVDRVTDMRIGNLVGGDNPDSEQIKQNRVFNMAQYAQLNATWPDGTRITDAEKTSTQDFIKEFYTQYAQIEDIRTQGTNFKILQGW